MVSDYFNKLISLNNVIYLCRKLKDLIGSFIRQSNNGSKSVFHYSQTINELDGQYFILGGIKKNSGVILDVKGYINRGFGIEDIDQVIRTDEITVSSNSQSMTSIGCFFGIYSVVFQSKSISARDVYTYKPSFPIYLYKCSSTTHNQQDREYDYLLIFDASSVVDASLDLSLRMCDDKSKGCLFNSNQYHLFDIQQDQTSIQTFTYPELFNTSECNSIQTVEVDENLYPYSSTGYSKYYDLNGIQYRISNEWTNTSYFNLTPASSFGVISNIFIPAWCHDYSSSSESEFYNTHLYNIGQTTKITDDNSQEWLSTNRLYRFDINLIDKNSITDYIHVVNDYD